MLESWFQYVYQKNNTIFDSKKNIYKCNGVFDEWIKDVTSIKFGSESVSLLLNDNKDKKKFIYFNDENMTNKYIKKNMEFHQKNKIFMIFKL